MSAPIFSSATGELRLSDIGDRQRTGDRVVSWLWTGVLFTALVCGVYGVNWFLAIDRLAANAPQLTPILTMPPPSHDDPGKLGDHPDPGNAPEEMFEREIAAPAAQVDAVAAVLAAAEQVALDELAANPNRRIGGDGGGAKVGDHIGPEKVARRSARWSFAWEADQPAMYRKQLDDLGVYIGAVRGGQLVGAARGFSGAAAEISQVVPDLWFVHDVRARCEIDRQLLKAAGVDVLPTDIVAQFFPRPLQDRLAELEWAFANRPVADIARTVFGVRFAGGRYEVFVLEQQSR